MKFIIFLLKFWSQRYSDNSKITESVDRFLDFQESADSITLSGSTFLRKESYYSRCL